MNSAITTEGLRHFNRALVLQCLRGHGPSSHTEIAKKTGLASGTVSAITAEFLGEGVLAKLEQAPASGRGRPRIQFAPMPDFATLAFARVSAETIEYSLMDYAGNLKDRQSQPRGDALSTAPGLEQGLRGSLPAFFDRSGLSAHHIDVLSFTSKGVVDEDRNQLIWSPITGNDPVDFATLMPKGWRGSVTLRSEASFVAHHVMLRQLTEGALKPGQQHAVLGLSDSIALGVAKYTDAEEIELSAPTFGHMMHRPDGPLCRCGGRGCLETYAGFYGILRTAFDAPENVIPAKFIPLEQMRRIAGLARSGDRMAEHAFRQAGSALGVCLSRMFDLLGAMPVTVVGSGIEFFDLIQPGLMSELSGGFTRRLGQDMPLELLTGDDDPAFASNAFVSLRNFDRRFVATRRLIRDRAGSSLERKVL